ncbi:unnamed protein product [Gemmataceae bacterium]|jgi:hypothetical protein|nr:unnamed protein product [Gemmataceae bacterium]VTT99088.1 unnamed protein product [Gemmataceae bacterium]
MTDPMTLPGSAPASHPAVGAALHGPTSTAGTPEALNSDTLAQVAGWLELEAMYNAGGLREYRGEYVFWAGGAVLAHGRALLPVSREAEDAARSRGIAPDQIAHYFVPGE